jgi:hypothetical protein
MCRFPALGFLPEKTICSMRGRSATMVESLAQAADSQDLSIADLTGRFVQTRQKRRHKVGPVLRVEHSNSADHPENPTIEATQTASHNPVLGALNTDTSYGSILGGAINTDSSAWSTLGGSGNAAPFGLANVVFGSDNTATGFDSSVSGGVFNTASGEGTSVSGGNTNTASGRGASSVSGGAGNTASGESSSVSAGGRSVTI